MRNVALALAVAGVVAVPVALHGAAPEKKSGDYATKKVCETEGETGSRLARVRRCRTQAEKDQRKAESRQTVERIQALKPTFGN